MERMLEAATILHNDAYTLGLLPDYYLIIERLNYRIEVRLSAMQLRLNGGYR